MLLPWGLWRGKEQGARSKGTVGDRFCIFLNEEFRIRNKEYGRDCLKPDFRFLPFTFYPFLNTDNRILITEYRLLKYGKSNPQFII